MIQLENLSKIYRTRAGEVKALDEVNLQVNENEFLVIRGPSGSGKTTLLLTIGGMLRPTKGRVLVDGNDVYAISERKRSRFRAKNIGFVFQMFHLVPYLNVIENVHLSPFAGKQKQTEMKELLDYLRMSDRGNHKPSELSTGEKQRAAIARALFCKPKFILADEPTGNLDPENAGDVIKYLSEFHHSGGTVIVVTHGAAADQYADRVIQLQNGRIDKR